MALLHGGPDFFFFFFSVRGGWVECSAERDRPVGVGPVGVGPVEVGPVEDFGVPGAFERGPDQKSTPGGARPGLLASGRCLQLETGAAHICNVTVLPYRLSSTHF